MADFSCPTCHNALDIHAAIADGTPPRPPLPGDLCICAYCHSVLVFGLFGLQLATTADVETTNQDEGLKRRLLHLITQAGRPH